MPRRLPSNDSIKNKAVMTGGGRADYGTAERWQHGVRLLQPTDCAGQFAAQVMEEHVLDRLIVQQVIDALARDAGVRLWVDYQQAHLASRVTASYSAVRGVASGGYQEYERSEREEAAYQSWRAAVRAVGLTDSRVVLDVCCYHQTPLPHSRLSLQRGLARLAQHYGLKA